MKYKAVLEHKLELHRGDQGIPTSLCETAFVQDSRAKAVADSFSLILVPPTSSVVFFSISFINQLKDTLKGIFWRLFAGALFHEICKLFSEQPAEKEWENAVRANTGLNSVL